MVKDPRIDKYISASAPFAKPILKHIRKLVHETCADAEETMKWSFPHFNYKGSTLCSMAAFKAHCAFGFWKAALMKNATILKQNQLDAMGHLGRITTLKDLPSDKDMIAMIEEAMMLNETGARLPAPKKATVVKDIAVPEILSKKLSKEKKAAETFNAFSPSHKREYCEWISEAKTEATQTRRADQAIEWLKEGKSRHWKYKK